MRISDWSSDVCSSDLHANREHILCCFFKVAEFRLGRISAACFVTSRVEAIEQGIIGEAKVRFPVETEPSREFAPFLWNRCFFRIAYRRQAARCERKSTRLTLQ